MVEWKISRKTVEYHEASEFMCRRVESIIVNQASELIWLLEHPSIYTAGTSAKQSELLKSTFPTFYTGRGGKFTYHGPGQLVVYLLLDLKKREMKDVKRYVYNLEQVIIDSLHNLSVRSKRMDDKIGIWVLHDYAYKKIAAIGVRVRKWVTCHGLALNINPNLAHYDSIIPCGIKGYGVTSLCQLGVTVEKNMIIQILSEHIRNTFISSKTG